MAPWSEVSRAEGSNPGIKSFNRHRLHLEGDLVLKHGQDDADTLR